MQREQPSRITWGRVEPGPEGADVEVSGPAPFPCPGCGGELGRVSGASMPTYWCSRCKLAVVQPDDETAEAIEAQVSGDEEREFATVGDLWDDEAEVKARMAWLKGGRKTGRRRRTRRSVNRRAAPLVTPDEDAKAAEEARRRIAEWETGREAA